MSSSNKRTKQARPLYAENRRKQIRLEKEKSPRSDVEKELIQYFQEIGWCFKMYADHFNATIQTHD